MHKMYLRPELFPRPCVSCWNCRNPSGACLLRVVTRRFSDKLKRPFRTERLRMKRFASFSLSVVLVLALVVASERRAWGYVDPGSGLIALQTIASVLAAWAYMVRRRIRAFFTRKKEETPVALPIAGADGSREVA